MTLKYSLYGVNKRKDVFKDVKNFRSFHVAVSAGSATLKYLREDGYTNIIVAKDYEHLNNLLERGRVDFIASSKLAMSSFMKKYKYDNDYFSPYKKLNYVDIDLYYAMSKGSDKRLVDTISGLLESHKKDLVLP